MGAPAEITVRQKSEALEWFERADGNTSSSQSPGYGRRLGPSDMNGSSYYSIVAGFTDQSRYGHGYREPTYVVNLIPEGGKNSGDSRTFAMVSGISSAEVLEEVHTLARLEEGLTSSTGMSTKSIWLSFKSNSELDPPPPYSQ